MVSAAILAGGRATRFGGGDKGSLVVDGRTIFERQVSELSQIAGEILVVGPRAPRPGIRGPRDADAVRAVADLVPGLGPLGGLHTALTEAKGDVTIVVACDMPYVSARFLAYLVALADEADAVVPQTERGYHPLCAAYTRATIDPVARRLAAGQLKMTDLLADVRLRVVTADEIGRFGERHRLLANVNTPAEYDGLEALQSHEL